MRQRIGLWVAASALVAVASSAGACGGGDESSTTSAGSPSSTSTTGSSSGPSTVNASLGEYFIRLEKSSAPAGRVTFDVSNDGKIEHEFVVIKTNVAPGDLPQKGNEADEDVGPSPGELPSVKPGQTKKLSLDLKPGKYALICNLPGHYKLGQFTGFAAE